MQFCTFEEKLFMTKTDIACAFSNGDFANAFPYLHDKIVWQIVEEAAFTGKEAVMQQCRQVKSYFDSVTTRFKTNHVISEANKVVVSGTAEFLRDDVRLSFVSACDLYEFDEDDRLVHISSYCIQKPDAAD
jgi:hypothetical protein